MKISPTTLHLERNAALHIYTPFTYWIFHKPSKKFYYGSRTAKNCQPSDLWNIYFTSSGVVKTLIKEYGKESFIIKIDKTFELASECLEYEYNVLKKFKAGKNPRFLNLHHTKSVEWTPERLKKTSETHKNVPLSVSHCESISKSKKGIKRKRFSKSHTDNLSKSAKNRKPRNTNSYIKSSLGKKRRNSKLFFNINGDWFYGSLFDFADRYNYDRLQVNSVLSGNNKGAYKGWYKLDSIGL